MARDEFHDQPTGAERRRNVHRRCQREEEKQVWRIRLEVSPGLRTGKIGSSMLVLPAAKFVQN